MLGEVIPHDEQRWTCQLLRSDFGKKLFHKLILRAATLEAALVKASMSTKGATTSPQQHFQHEFVNEAIAVYTMVLLEGGEPELHLLARLLPPPHFLVVKQTRMVSQDGGTNHGPGLGQTKHPLRHRSTNKRMSPS